VVVGPGLGRHENTMHSVAQVITQSLQYQKPLVIDGDGLWILSQLRYRDLFANNKNQNIVLTPNAMEFRRLWINHILKQDITATAQKTQNEYLPPFDTVDLIQSNDEQKSNDELQAKLKYDAILSVKEFDKIQHIKDTALLATTMGGVTILRKGAVDIITNGDQFCLISEPHSLRRCGGQGDILAGVIGLWLHWCCMYPDSTQIAIPITAAYAGSYLTRQFAVDAFNKYKRSTLTTDMIECIPTVMDKEFPLIQSSL